MTYYTLPKLFRCNNTSVINNIILILSNKDEIDNSLLEKFLSNFLRDKDKKSYEEIKAKYSFTDLLNLKISDEEHHPKSYFAFIEINKISNIFNKDKLISLHMSDDYEYLDALYQIRKKKDHYIHLNDTIVINPPSFLTTEILNKNNLENIIFKYTNKIELICLNYDDINLIIKYLFISIILQKYGGNFVMKIKRLNNYISKEIIYLLMSLYENVLIVKPKIVNSLNEYKYLVATNMNVKLNQLHISILQNNILKLLCDKNNINIKNILNVDLPQVLINKVDECELIMSENILTTHMKVLNSIHINNINMKSLEKKTQSDSNNWIKENY